MVEKDSDKKGMSNPDVEENGAGGEGTTESSKQVLPVYVWGQKHEGRSYVGGRGHHCAKKKNEFCPD